jgi:hypothetical protein
MSESHEVVLSSLAILLAKHQGLELNDEQMLLLLNVEASLPEALAEAIKKQIVVKPEDLKRLLKAKFRPSLEAADGDVGANGEILMRLLAFLEQLLPMILPLFVKQAK